MTAPRPHVCTHHAHLGGICIGCPCDNAPCIGPAVTPPLKLFAAETGGATYWVAAHDCIAAMELVSDCLDTPAGIMATEMTAEESLAVRIQSNGHEYSLGQMFASAHEPEVIACSEWS